MLPRTESRVSSSVLMPSGPAHLHIHLQSLLYCALQSRCEAPNPKCCIRQGVGTVLLSQPQGWLICAFAIRTSSTVLPRQGTGLILPDATASSPALMILGPALPTATEGMIGGRHYPHAFSTSWQMSGQGSSSLHVPLGPLTSTQSLGIALLCCSREVQGQLSRVLQPMKGRVSSPDSHM